MTGKKQNLQLVGKILEKQNDTLDFLRPNNTKNKVFVYPSVRDVSEVKADQIISFNPSNRFKEGEIPI